MNRLLLFLFIGLILSGFDGKAQTALEFDGVDDYVQTSFPGVSENNPRTFQAWIYLTEAPSSDMCILDFGANEEGARNTFMVNQNGYLQFDMGGDMLIGTFGGTLPIGEWIHVAFVYDGGEGYLYVNGLKVDNTEFELLTPEDEEPLRIGESIWGGMPFKGMIDEVSIWQTGMEDEIIECYNGAIPEQVVAYYDFNDGSGMTLTELVAGWNGTLENMTEDAWVASTVCTTSYNVSFIVTKDDGTTPIENAMVDLDGIVQYTNASGETAFEASVGIHNYTVSKAGYFDETSTVEVVNADVTVDVSMTLNGINGDITFIVTDGTNPLENALVDLDGVQQLTDASGETVFTDYLPETYDYTITKSDYYEQSGSVEVIDGDVTENVILALIVYYDITFIVTEGAGTNPIENALVEFDGVQQYTDASGETTFIGYLPEIYGYLITKDIYYSESGEVEVIDDDVTVEVSLLTPVLTALDFDGTNEYVQTSCLGVLGNNPRTLMAWIYLDEASSGTRCIMDYGANNPYSRNTFMVNGSGYLSYLSGGSGSGVTADVASIPVNEWVSVAFVYDGSDAFLYQNGEQVGTKTFVSGINTQSGGQNLKIGQRVAGGSIPFNGMIDEVKIWNVALTLQEITEYACIGDPSLYSNLLANYDFNEGTGTTLHDIAGGYNGTLLEMEEEDWIDSDVCVFSAYNISFVVTGEDGTTPIENASVDLDGEIKYTNANGAAIYYFYDPGTYNYTISKAGYFDETGTVEVVDQNVTVNVNLILTGIEYDITFVVTDDLTGDPLEDALVELEGVQQYTDEFGETIFTGYVSGTYNYLITKDEYFDQSGSVEVVDQNVTIDVNLSPSGILYDINFFVTDDFTNNPLEDALVELDGVQQYTDEVGETVFSGYVSGTYDYSITKDDYYEQSGSVEVIDGDVTVNISLVPILLFFDITFIVTDDLSGDPVEDALVDLDGLQQYTDISGETVFTEYLSGTYNYSITKGEYYEQSGSVEVIGDDVTVNISLVPILYFDITFIVTDDLSGDPLEDALVDLDGLQQYTNASGETTFIGYLPDIYPFTISKEEYFTYSDNVEVVDENLTVEVGLLWATNTPTALEFDGVDDYVQTTYPGVAGIYSRTFQAWIYLNEAPGSNLCISDYGFNVAGGRNTFMVNNNGYLAYLSGGANGGITASEATVPIGQWVHVAFVYNGSEGYLYQDGEQVGTGNLTGVNTQLGGQDVLIGQRVSGGNIPFNGMIDEFSIWDMALSPQEIIDYACIGDPSQYGHLICYYDFNEGTGSTLLDQVGDYDGTLMNMNDQAWVPSDVCAYGHNITFIVTQNGTTPIGNASVDLDGEIKFTNGYGKVSFYYYAPGAYNYTVSKDGYFDETGTVDVIDQDVTVNINLLVTGILQNELNNVSIYPNPTNGVVNVRLPEEYSGNITITDISGRVIDRFIIHNSNEKIDLSGVQKGMYFIKLQQSNKIVTLPLLIR